MVGVDEPDPFAAEGGCDLAGPGDGGPWATRAVREQLAGRPAPVGAGVCGLNEAKIAGADRRKDGLDATPADLEESVVLGEKEGAPVIGHRADRVPVLAVQGDVDPET